jgi:hypothetical protein
VINNLNLLVEQTTVHVVAAVSVQDVLDAILRRTVCTGRVVRNIYVADRTATRTTSATATATAAAAAAAAVAAADAGGPVSD